MQSLTPPFFERQFWFVCISWKLDFHFIVKNRSLNFLTFEFESQQQQQQQQKDKKKKKEICSGTARRHQLLHLNSRRK